MSNEPTDTTEANEEIIESTPARGPRLLVGLAVGLTILSGSSGLAWYFWANQEEAQRRPQRTKVADVQAVRLKATNFTIHLPSQGRVQARAATGISPEVAGRIVSIEPVFKEGGFFAPGQKLLTLDNSDYLNTVAKAEGSLSQLEAKLALERINRAGYSNAFNVAQANLEQANAALKLQVLERNSYSNAVSVAQANLKQSEATLALKRAERSAAIANLKRLGKLEGSSPLARKEPQVAEAQADVDSKLAALEKAKKDLLEKPLQMESDLQAKIKVAQVQLIEAKEDLARPDQLEADLRAQIKVAESELAKAQRDATRTVVRAPMYPGRITEKRVDIGQVVAAGSVLATAIATDFAEVRLPVSNRQLAHLNIPEPLVRTYDTQSLANQPAQNHPPVELRAEIGSDVHRWNGRIDRAEGRFDANSQQLFLIAQVPEPYRQRPALRAGLFVRADITGNTLDNVFVLERHAVRRGNEVALAMHDPGGWVLQRREIEILWSNERVILTRSLKPGDVLITSPIDYATNGQTLRVQVAGEAPPPEKKGKGKPSAK